MSRVRFVSPLTNYLGRIANVGDVLEVVDRFTNNLGEWVVVTKDGLDHVAMAERVVPLPELGAVVGAVLEAGNTSAYWDDPMSRYAPAECHTLVLHNARRKVERILEDAGYSNLQALLDEVEARTTKRFVEHVLVSLMD